MTFQKKVWTDRIAEYINRRTLTKSNGTTEVVTVSRNEGEVSQAGDAFSAANMNDLETRIKNEFDSINTNLTESFIYTVDNSGALIIPLDSNKSVYSIELTVHANSQTYVLNGSVIIENNAITINRLMALRVNNNDHQPTLWIPTAVISDTNLQITTGASAFANIQAICTKHN